MSLPARRELLASTAPRYAKANKKQKQTILDEFEGEAYERVLAVVKLRDNSTVDAYVYALKGK